MPPAKRDYHRQILTSKSNILKKSNLFDKNKLQSIRINTIFAQR